MVMSIYQKPMAIDRNRHASVRVSSVPGFGFARTCQVVPLAASEVVEAAREYPVVFARTEGKLSALAVLGVRNNENLFVKPDGQWDGRYIPALIRQYPFVIIDGRDGLLTLGIDEVRTEDEAYGGERLFDEEGKNTDILDRMLSFLSAMQSDFVAIENLLIEVDSLGVLEPMNARFAMVDGRSFDVRDFLVADQNKLRALEGDGLESAHKSGAMALIYAHIWSISNFNRLLEKIPAL